MKIKLDICLKSLMLAAMIAGVSTTSTAQEPGEAIISQVTAMGVAPPTNTPSIGDEAKGPFNRLVIKNANLIDGTGAPLQGGVTITIENDRIVKIEHVGGTRAIGGGETEDPNTHVIDASGKYVLPGLIDVHTHLGNPLHIYGGKLTDPEYVFKLYLAHGVTTVRDVGSLMGLKWLVDQKNLSDSGKISAPRIIAYALFPEDLDTAAKSKEWVRAVHRRGADGVKFLGASPIAIKAALSEIQTHDMGSAYHHAQISVTRLNALDTAEMGLDSLEHWYGIPEAMFSDRVVQDYPLDYDYNNEQDRFREAGKLWQQTAKPGSDIWQKTIHDLITADLTLNPTFSVYEPARDLARVKDAEWHPEYTMPYMTRMFEANPRIHGSFFFDWTTTDEVAWRKNFQLWMTFINDYKNAGGRVAAGSDSGFMYSTYGFGYVRELELLQEAGFHPLEVLTSATLNGAELLNMDSDIGSIEVGKKADLIIANENPLTNFKVLYASGHANYDWEAGKMSRSQGIQNTIKDGIVFDNEQLREDVRTLVSAQKKQDADAARSVAK